MNLHNITILTVALAAISMPIQAQRSKSRTTAKPITLEDLPKIAIDTIDTPDPETKVILFTNNTWSYFRPTLDNKHEENPVFTRNWDTTHVFAYKNIELRDLSEITNIKLINNLREFHYPIRGRVFSKYGRRGRRNHNGVDIPLTTGEPIYATFAGKVRYSQYNNGGFGNLVIVRHDNGLETWYAHLSKLNVESNDYVKSGQVIGYGGSTGRSRGPHLHFEVRYYDQTFDPEFLFDFASGSLRYQTFALEKQFFNIHSRASDQLEDYDGSEITQFLANEDNTSEDILQKIAKSQTAAAKPKETTVSGTNSASGTVYHTIKQNDILGKLAVRYGVSIDQICRLNNISKTTTLKLGRKLRIR